jgi:hypothetical protein
VTTFCGYDQAAQDGRRGAAVRCSNSSRDVPELRSRSIPQWLPRRWRTALCQTGGCDRSGRGTYIRRSPNALFGFSSQPPQSRSNLVCVRQRPGSSPTINTDALSISTSFPRFSRTRKVGRTVRNDGTATNQGSLRHIVPLFHTSPGRVRRASSSARPRHLQSLLQSTTRYSMGKSAVWDPAMLENQAAAAGAPILIEPRVSRFMGSTSPSSDLTANYLPCSCSKS